MKKRSNERVNSQETSSDELGEFVDQDKTLCSYSVLPREGSEEISQVARIILTGQPISQRIESVRSVSRIFASDCSQWKYVSLEKNECEWMKKTSQLSLKSDPHNCILKVQVLTLRERVK
jgi:hypothetical protein